MRSCWLFLVLFLLVACGGVQQKKAAPPFDPSTVTIDGNKRLPDDVVPKNYRVDLQIDPSKDRFSGAVTIDVSIKNETQVIHLHSGGLTVKTASIIIGGTPMEAKTATGENGGLIVYLETKIAPTDATLKMEFDGPLDEVPTGLYRVKDGDGWYAFTQFEPLEARTAFPSFDEPKFKTPFTMSINVPRGMMAVANTPEVSKTQNEFGELFTFAVSKAMPTYLVALAVGTFDVVEASADAIANVPFRVLTTKGKGGLAKYMLDRTPRILTTITDYMGTKYPYAKLDVIAVPNFSAGAMENIGLVTFRERLLLIDPASASIGSRRAAVSVMAHELAHMWFGNLVTMPWWDDLWLNEAFATWMASKVVDIILPQLESNIDTVSSVGSWVMATDSQANARAIRQPIEHGGDVYNAFDGLTYQKGAAVIRMFESWLGEDELKAAIQVYMSNHAHENATTGDFLKALDSSSGKQVGTKFRTFLDQPGVPKMETKMECGEKTMINVKQTRYLPAGSTAKAEAIWNVPMCVRFEQKGKSVVHCDIVDTAEKSIELPAAKCPKWFYPNANESGYFRWTMPAKDLDNLVKRFRNKLSVAEKVGMFSNLNALRDAEAIDPLAYLKAVEQLTKEKHRTIARQSVSAMWGFEDLIENDPKKKKRFGKKVKRLLQGHMARVGYKPRANEKVDRTLLRPTVLSAMSYLTDDKRAKKQAAVWTEQFMADPSSLPNDLVSFATCDVARDGDEALWNKLKSAIATAPTPQARVATIRALGCFRDPALLKKSLALTLDGTLRAQDFWTLVGRTRGHEPLFESVTWPWFTTNFDGIVTLIGAKRTNGLPGMGSAFCSVEGKAKVTEFFATRTTPGMERRLKNTLESIDQCVRYRGFMGTAVRGYFK